MYQLRGMKNKTKEDREKDTAEERKKEVDRERREREGGGEKTGK